MRAEGSDYRSIEEAARFFDVTVVTIKRWLDDGCPVVEKGTNGKPYKLDLRAMHDWREGRRQAEQDEQIRKAEVDAQLKLELLGDDSLTVAGDKKALSARERADALAAEINAIKLAQKRGELVRAGELRLDLARSLQMIRDSLLALPDEMGRECGLGDAMVNILQERIETRLTDLTDRIDASMSAAVERERFAA